MAPIGQPTGERVPVFVQPGGNGPSDYGFTDPVDAPLNYSIPTPPGQPPPASPYPWAYPSPSGLSSHEGTSGNFGNFTGNTTVGDPVGSNDVPYYNADTPPYPPGLTPPSYNQLNDAATASAFATWINSHAPTANKWFAAVSFINPHDITQFPYSFDLAQGSPCSAPTSDFCEPTIFDPNSTGYQSPLVTFGAAPTYSSNDYPASSETTTLAAFPTNPANSSGPLLYSSSATPQDLYLGNTGGYDTPWNNADVPTPYSTTSHTGKPDLQTSFLDLFDFRTGEVVNADGWYTFLNYYFWMQACVDLQVGNVLNSLKFAQGTDGHPGPFANNTVVIFTSDHGDYAGSHGLHAKGGALYDEVMCVPLYISIPSTTPAMIPRSYVCSSVDFLPFLYSLALGNESWRCNPDDIISYLNGRESILDAIFLGTQNAQQRRLTSFPLTNSQGGGCWQQYQPYVLHTQDEYWQFQTSQDIQSHAVAFRTVDNTLNGVTTGDDALREQGPFGGGKLGIYSYWGSESTEPLSGGAQQFEFYNYQPSAPANTGTLSPNLGEVGNDYWLSNNSGAIAAQYIAAYNPASYASGELGIIDPKILNGYNSALALWLNYVLQSTSSTCPS
jgi:hypothetical protein